MDETLRRLIDCIFDSHDDDIIDCDTCDRHFAELAELVASGADTQSLLPAVHQHLDCCADCKEEFDALLAIVSAEISGRTTSDHPASSINDAHA